MNISIIVAKFLKYKETICVMRDNDLSIQSPWSVIGTLHQLVLEED